MTRLPCHRPQEPRGYVVVALLSALVGLLTLGGATYSVYRSLMGIRFEPEDVSLKVSMQGGFLPTPELVVTLRTAVVHDGWPAATLETLAYDVTLNGKAFAHGQLATKEPVTIAAHSTSHVTTETRAPVLPLVQQGLQALFDRQVALSVRGQASVDILGLSVERPFQFNLQRMIQRPSAGELGIALPGLGTSAASTPEAP
jgi:hypothetical protein